MKALPADERKNRRQLSVKPLVEAYFTWVRENLPKVPPKIIGNCDIQLILGCTDDVTAEYFSGRSGEMSIEVSSTMTTRQTIALAQVIPQYRQTQGQGRRKLLTPDEVLRLPNTELLCIIRGCNILKLTIRRSRQQIFKLLAI